MVSFIERVSFIKRVSFIQRVLYPVFLHCMVLCCY